MNNNNYIHRSTTPPSPVLLLVEGDLDRLVDHVQYQTVLVAGAVGLIQVVPHGHIQRQLHVVMEEKAVETRVVLQRPVMKTGVVVKW